MIGQRLYETLSLIGQHLRDPCPDWSEIRAPPSLDWAAHHGASPVAGHHVNILIESEIKIENDSNILWIRILSDQEIFPGSESCTVLEDSRVK